MSDTQSILVFALLVFVIIVWRFPSAFRGILNRTKELEISKDRIKITFAVQSAIESFRQKGAEVPSEKQIEHQLHPLQGYHRVLWVDDNPTNNIFEIETLLGLGWQVDIADTNDHAARLMGQFQYDLIISDIGRSPPETPTAGLDLPTKLRQDGVKMRPIVYYIGTAERAETDDGFPVTDRPDTLFVAIQQALLR